MQAAVMSYCLKNALPEGGQTLEDMLRLAAQEGIEHVEVYAGAWEVDGDIRKAAEGLRQVADDTGVRLPVMGSGTRLGNLGNERDVCLDLLKRESEACAILGGTVMTLPIVDGQPVPPDQENARVGVRFERMLPELVAQLQELADHAANHGVELAVLNHCFLVYLGWHQKWLTLLTERANVGACVDPGNYLHYGHEDPVAVCRELAGMTKMVRAGNVAPVAEEEVIAQFKDVGEFRPWGAAPFDNGVIDQEACYRYLAEGGYTGFLSLKTAGPSPDGPLAAIRHSWQALVDVVGRVS